MENRLKLRAWLKKYKMLVPVESIDFRNKTIEVFLSPENVDAYEFTFDEVELQECTGLSDKNGKLIYESDIVKVRNEYIEQVVWHNSGWKLLYCKTKNWIYTNSSDQLEIIGDIYTTPELLEVAE